MAGGTTFDTDLATTTVDKYVRLAVADQIFTDHGFLRWVEEKVGVERLAGGDNLLIPLRTAEDAGGGSYSGYDTFDTTPSESLTNAVARWKEYQQQIVANAFDVLRNNRTPEGILNMWTLKAEEALQSMRSKLNTHAQAASVGNSGKNIQGIGLLVDSAGTVQGINRSTATYWQANEVAVSGALAIDTSVGLLRTFLNCGTGSGDKSLPDLILTDQDEYEAYEALLAPDIRHTSRTMGDGTFSGLAFKGAPFMYDRDAIAGVLYMLNSKSFGFAIHPDRDFMTTEIAQAKNGTLQQDAWIAHILAWPELFIMEPRRDGKLTGLTD